MVDELDEHGVPGDMEGRVSRKVVASLSEPVVDLLRSIRRLVIFLFVTMLVVQTVVSVTVYQQNQSRARTVAHIDANTRANAKAAAEAKAAADRARAAAEQASADLAAAIASSRNIQPDPAIAKALAQIDCIAHHRDPCP